MKDPLKRTKVVIRHLPPSLSKTDFLFQIDGRFFDRYDWFCFRPGKFSQKNQRYSRAYINFKRPEDVFEFAEFFNGHVFVNEKGHQFKTIVEYAPSQLVPKPCKKDGREGTIYKDPDYLEFIKLIAKPDQHLPSAEIQLERKEAEQSGAVKEDPVITPLMEFIRKKRAAGNGTQASFGKVSRRNGQTPSSKHGSPATKRISEKKKYIQKNSTKNKNRKDKSNAISAARQENQQATLTVGATKGSITGITLNADSGKKKILLIKGKEHEILNVSEGMLPQPSVTSAVESMPISVFQKQNHQRREAGGRMTRSILQKNEARQSQSSTAVQCQQKIQNLNLEIGKRPQRMTTARGGSVGHVPDGKSPEFDFEGEAKRTSVDRLMKKDMDGLDPVCQKQEKRVRTRDRPDRGVWAPLRRSDVPPSQESISSTVTQSTQSSFDSVEGSRRHYGHCEPADLTKNESSLNITEGKHSKRGGAAGFGAHEKQVWVQKTS